MNHINCSVIIDLLPPYAENLVMEETKELIEEHLNTCESCRHLYEEASMELKMPEKKMSKNERSIIRNMKFKYVWYFFWPLLYGICLLFEFRATTQLFIMATIFGAWMLIFSHHLDYAFDLDDTKKAFYEKSEERLAQGKRTVIGEGFTLLLPILIPTLIQVILLAIPWFFQQLS